MILVFLNQPIRDLAMICALAGMNMGAVIEAMRENIHELPYRLRASGKA